MKTRINAIMLVCLATAIAGCGIMQKPTAQAIIATHDHDTGKGFTTDLLAYVKTTNFVNSVSSLSGLPDDAVAGVRFQPYRDTTLLEVTASSSSSSNALALVETSITVIRQHFDALGKKRQADSIRADSTKPEDQKKIEIAIMERIPRTSVEVVERPRIMEK